MCFVLSVLVCVHANEILDRTIHAMAYNALKILEELNPELFEDCLRSLKENRAR